MLLHGRLDVSVGGQQRRRPNRGSRPFVDSLIQGHVDVDDPPEVDDSKDEEQQQGCDDCELDNRL
jgi:hypothetical protein